MLSIVIFNKFLKTTFIVVVVYFIVKYLIVFNSIKDIYILSSDLNVRAKPEMGSEILHVLKKGTKVKKFAEKRNWFKIKLRKGNGYIHSKYVKPVPFTNYISFQDVKTFSASILTLTVLIKLTNKRKNGKSRKQNKLPGKNLNKSYLENRKYVKNVESARPGKRYPSINDKYASISSHNIKTQASDTGSKYSGRINNYFQNLYMTGNISTNFSNGIDAERKLVSKLISLGFLPENIFHDIYIEKGVKNFSQIDLLLITDAGIIVFEVKDYSGWIYGDGNSKYWTQVLAYGKQKYKFYNPVRQNYNHINVLKRKLSKYVSGIPFFSVILFFGDCNLKNINYIPKGTFVGKSEKLKDILSAILQNNPPVKYLYRNEIKLLLKEAAEKGKNIETKRQHIENIEDLTGKKRIFI